MGLISKALPKYSGPHHVGTLDLELPVAHRTFGTALLRSTQQPALQLDTVLFTLFYPADDHKKGTGKRMTWVQRPLGQTAKGYARFTNKPPWLVHLAFILFAASTRLPAEIDRPLVPPMASMSQAANEGGVTSEDTNLGDHLAPDNSTSSTLIDPSHSATPLAQNSDSLPLLIFSHGLGGNRTTYSQYCGELASRGYVVAAVEHRDGSGPISVVRLDNQGQERVVDYIQTDDLVFPPPNPTLSQLEHRREQLVMRLAEIEHVLDFMKRINAGEGSSLASQNRRAMSASYGSQLASWNGRLNEARLSQLGHSFGGATSLEVLRAGEKRFPFINGIMLDPWTDPIDPASTPGRRHSSSAAPTAEGDNLAATKRGATEIDVPIMVINSEAFTLWQTHYKLVRTIVETTQKPSWFMTLVGSIHLSFSDFPLILPFIASRAGARVDAKQAMNMFVEASHEFLAGQGTDGKILGGEVIPGDEKGVRPGEGYKQRGGHPMEKVGEVRMHVRPDSKAKL